MFTSRFPSLSFALVTVFAAGRHSQHVWYRIRKTRGATWRTLDMLDHLQLSTVSWRATPNVALLCFFFLSRAVYPAWGFQRLSARSRVAVQAISGCERTVTSSLGLTRAANRLFDTQPLLGVCVRRVRTRTLKDLKYVALWMCLRGFLQWRHNCKRWLAQAKFKWFNCGVQRPSSNVCLTDYHVLNNCHFWTLVSVMI